MADDDDDDGVVAVGLPLPIGHEGSRQRGSLHEGEEEEARDGGGGMSPTAAARNGLEKMEDADADADVDAVGAEDEDVDDVAILEVPGDAAVDALTFFGFSSSAVPALVVTGNLVVAAASGGNGGGDATFVADAGLSVDGELPDETSLGDWTLPPPPLTTVCRRLSMPPLPPPPPPPPPPSVTLISAELHLLLLLLLSLQPSPLAVATSLAVSLTPLPALPPKLPGPRSAPIWLQVLASMAKGLHLESACEWLRRTRRAITVLCRCYRAFLRTLIYVALFSPPKTRKGRWTFRNFYCIWGMLVWRGERRREGGREGLGKHTHFC